VKLILNGGRTVRGVARDLGIHETMLHRWRKEIHLKKDLNLVLTSRPLHYFDNVMIELLFSSLKKRVT